MPILPPKYLQIEIKKVNYYSKMKSTIRYNYINNCIIETFNNHMNLSFQYFFNRPIPKSRMYKSNDNKQVSTNIIIDIKY